MLLKAEDTDVRPPLRMLTTDGVLLAGASGQSISTCVDTDHPIHMTSLQDLALLQVC